MRADPGAKRIVLLGTLDTKGPEIGYLKSEIEKRGHRVVVIDAGILGTPLIQADIPREDVAEAGGKKLEDLVEQSRKITDRMPMIQVMIDGAKRTVVKLHELGELDGIVSLGGSMGMAIGVNAMKALPVGIPRLMVGTHLYPQYLQESGLCVLQCPTDIMGLNPVTNFTLRQAAGAISGMVEADLPEEKARPLVAITGLGVTTSGVMGLQSLLGGMGNDTVVFHANSVFMDQLIDKGSIDGVIDFSPNELIRIFIISETPERKDRLGPAGRKGLPQVIVPGALDQIVLRMARDQIPRGYYQRKIYLHGPYITAIRTSREELAALARIIAEKAGQAAGPVAVVFPSKGFSAIDMEGKAFYEPDTDRVFLEVLKEHRPKGLQIYELDAHILDEAFVKEVASIYDQMARKERKEHG